MRTLEIDGCSLSLDDVADVATRGRIVRLPERAVRAMERSRRVVERAARESAPVYGVNTGFGALAEVRIPTEKLRDLQLNLVRSHSAGVGAALPEDAVRAMMLLRANVLAAGYSGARPAVARQLVELLNRGAYPRIPEQGSVGASGDLAPLAHLASLLIGEGEAFVRDGRDERSRGRPPNPTDRALWRRVSGRLALRAARLKPLRLEAKEGIALINGTQAMTGLAALALLEAEALLRAADIIGAMTVEALMGSHRPFDSRIHELRPHPGQLGCAAFVRAMLAGSQVVESHAECGKVQDPYSLRCLPQIHGAARDVVAHGRAVVERELNAATDNPLVFPETGEMLSGGNFHGQPVAFAADFLAIAMTDLASVSERRVEQLVNPQLSGLPAFLTREGGMCSGFMVAQVTASALVAECRSLSVPASADNIPSSANREDHVSMGMWAARKARVVVRQARQVVAIELLCAAQALEMRRPLRSGRGVEAALLALRRSVPPLGRDRTLGPDIEAADSLLRDGSIVKAAERAAFAEGFAMRHPPLPGR